MRKLLIAVDGSVASVKALEYVVQRVASGEKIRAEALYSEPTPLVRNPEVERLIAKDRQKVLATDQTKKLLRRLRCKPTIRESDPAKLIINTALELDVDEIVIGSRGQGAFQKMFLGPVSSEVV